MSRTTRALLLALGWALEAETATAADPTKDECISAINAGEDLRQAGKLVEARAQFAVCVATSCPGALREDCVHRLDDLVASIPTIVFEAKDVAGNDVTAVHVTMDGASYASVLDGKSLEADPGEHRFVFDDELGTHAEMTVVARQGEKDRRVVVTLGGAPQASSAQPIPAPPSASRDGSVQRMIGLSVGSTGVIGFVVGGVLGFVAKSTYDGATQACRNGGSCTPADAQDSQSAHGEATASTVFFVAGLALATGGAALYFTAPKGPSVSVAPAVGAGGAGLRIAGAW